jgi:hypothetical protein
MATRFAAIVVRRLLTAMNGTIAVESVEGEGSAFTVTLPLGQAPANVQTTVRQANMCDLPTPFMTFEHVERLHLATALDLTGGNRDRASRLLGISPSTFKRHGQQRLPN